MAENTVHDRGKEQHRRAGDGGNEERHRRKRARACRKPNPFVTAAKKMEDTVFKYHNLAMEGESLYFDLFWLAEEYAEAVSFGKKMAEAFPSPNYDDSFHRMVEKTAASIPALVEGYQFADAQATKYHQLAMDAASSPVLRLYYSMRHDIKKMGKSEKWQTMKNMAAIAEEGESEEPVEAKEEEQHQEEEKEEEKQQLEEKEEDQVMGCCGNFWRWIRSWGRRNRGRV